MCGRGMQVVLLSPSRRRQPECDAPVAVMIYHVGCERLAADPKVGRAVRQKFLRLGKPEADVANGLMEILRQALIISDNDTLARAKRRRGAYRESIAPPRSTQDLAAHTLHHPAAGTVCPAKMLQPPAAAPALPVNCAHVLHF